MHLSMQIDSVIENSESQDQRCVSTLFASVYQTRYRSNEATMLICFWFDMREAFTDNPLYTDTRYNDKIRYNDKLTIKKPSLKR